MNATDGARSPLGLVCDIAACLAFMTRLDIKIPGLDAARPIGNGAWALPLAGAFMGAVAGAAYAIATGFGFGPHLAAALAVAAGAWATGARGEWGLASATEAASAGPFGATGATALVLAIVLRLATIAALDDFAVVMAAMMAAVALGAAATACVLYYLPASGADRAPTHNVLVACVVAVAIALLVLPFGGFAAVIIVIVVGIAVAAAHARLLGETTPAALGAIQLICETAALLAIAASA
jgi:adenosylcobinamide-GDP ribazoletransferase